MNGDKQVTANFIPDTYIHEYDFNQSSGTYFSIVPNPSSGVTEMRYSIQNAEHASGEISLLIYDVAGKLVKDLSSHLSLAAQPGSVLWTGLDANGKAVPNGLYFVKLRAGQYHETLKLLLLR